MESITGHAPEELTAAGPEALAALVHPDDRELMRERLARLSLEQGPSRSEYRILHRDGRVRWVEACSTSTTVGGKPAIQTSFLDITHQKAMETELKKKHFQLLQAQSIAGVGSWVFDFETGTVSATREAQRIYGVSGDQWSIPEIQAIPLPEYRPMMDRALRELMEDGTPYDLTFKIRQADSGAIRMIRALARYDEEENRVHGVIQDITEQKRAEEALRDSEEQLRRVIQESNDAIYILYQDRFDLVNQRFCELTDITPEELSDPGFTFWDLVAPESRPLIEERQRKRNRGEEVPALYGFSIRSFRGRTVHVEASVTEIDYRAGKAVMGILRDITEQKAMEEQLRQAQRMESLGRLSGGVAHDLNNLLSPILGYGEMLLEEPWSEEERKESAGEIVRAATRARDLVRQLLAFSRKQTLKFRSVDLNVLLEDFEPLLRRAIRENLTLEIQREAPLPSIEADIRQLEQVVMNLCVNAQDAMPGGGRLSLRTEAVDLDEAYAETRAGVTPGQYVLLAISDTGQGMSPSTQERIFEPFFTTKEQGKGTGLGLATVYGIVKQHGGNIWVYSEPGEGTTFKCYFPVDGSPGPSSRPIEDDEPEALEGDETVLVVEDDDMVRTLAKSILEKRGYRVLSAPTGEAGVELLDRHQGPLDLLLTDIVLPGMNGRDLSKRASARFPGVRTLFMSGYTDEVISHHGVLQEGIAFIQKPFSVRDLASRIRQMLDQKSQALES
jgi:PAS domain S-box-containing protein